MAIVFDEFPDLLWNCVSSPRGDELDRLSAIGFHFLDPHSHLTDVHTSPTSFGLIIDAVDDEVDVGDAFGVPYVLGDELDGAARLPSDFGGGLDFVESPEAEVGDVAEDVLRNGRRITSVCC